MSRTNNIFVVFPIDFKDKLPNKLIDCFNGKSMILLNNPWFTNIAYDFQPKDNGNLFKRKNTNGTGMIFTTPNLYIKYNDKFTKNYILQWGEKHNNGEQPIKKNFFIRKPPAISLENIKYKNRITVNPKKNGENYSEEDLIMLRLDNVIVMALEFMSLAISLNYNKFDENTDDEKLINSLIEHYAGKNTDIKEELQNGLNPCYFDNIINPPVWFAPKKVSITDKTKIGKITKYWSLLHLFNSVFRENSKWATELKRRFNVIDKQRKFFDVLQVEFYIVPSFKMIEIDIENESESSKLNLIDYKLMFYIKFDNSQENKNKSLINERFPEAFYCKKPSRTNMKALATYTDFKNLYDNGNTDRKGNSWSGFLWIKNQLEFNVYSTIGRDLWYVDKYILSQAKNMGNNDYDIESCFDDDCEGIPSTNNEIKDVSEDSKFMDMLDDE